MDEAGCHNDEKMQKVPRSAELNKTAWWAELNKALTGWPKGPEVNKQCLEARIKPENPHDGLICIICIVKGRKGRMTIRVPVSTKTDKTCKIV